MNVPRFILTTLLTSGLLAIATTAPAATAAKTAKPTPAERADQRASKQALVIKKATLKDLNLSVEQKQKLKELQTQQREKEQALRQEFEKQVEGLLTPEQLAKFKELNAKPAPAQDQPVPQTPKPARKKAVAAATAK
jgi:Spy/CpxP family protein refolding chaperone